MSIAGVETGDIVLRVRENPIINRVILEGNKRLKEDKIKKEIKLAPRQIFTRTAVAPGRRADHRAVSPPGPLRRARSSPRWSASTRTASTSCSRSTRGRSPRSAQINIIGNDVFSDGKLREQMATKQARLIRLLLSSNTSYDQDRLAYDQQKLRQFYLTQGYADFRVTSAVAELTPDKKDFIITYVVEEGQALQIRRRHGRQRHPRFRQQEARASAAG